MSFSSSKKQKDEWKVISVLGEIKKNKTDTLRITRVEFGDKELINLQVWRKNEENDTTFPMTSQNISVNVNLKDQLIEALENV